MYCQSSGYPTIHLPIAELANQEELLVETLENRGSQESVSGSSFSTLDVNEEFNFEDNTHANRVLAGLNTLRLASTFCDVTLCAESIEFPCHRVVLSSFSPYFKAMFAGNLAESQQTCEKVVINGIESNTLKLLLEYAYTSQVMINKANVQALLSAANLLEVLPVREACCQFLERHMDETNCLGIHCFAETHACSELMQKAKSFTLRHFREVTHQEEFLSLTRNKLVEFIKSDDLEVESEDSVFEAILAWLNFNSDVRREGFDRVLQHVRLPLLSPYYLEDQVSPIIAIAQSPECRVLVEEAKKFHLLPDRRREATTVQSTPRKAMGISDVIVAVGGEDDKVVLRSVECFDPIKSRWLSLACLPFAVSKHGLVVSGQNLLYMAGGEYPDGSASKSLWRYDPVFDQWQEMASMNVARSELGLTVLDGFLYAVGGWEGVSRLSSVERYDPNTNKWQFVSSMKIALTSPAVVSLNGLMYVAGGAVMEDGDGIENFQFYNPKSNTWFDAPPMLIARSGSAACILNGMIYILGGWQASVENTNKVECFDPAKQEWMFKKSMRERRYQAGAAVVNGKIFVCGGEEGWDRSPRYHDTIECYCPEKDTWNTVGIMQTSRSWLACAQLRLPKDSPAKERS